MMRLTRILLIRAIALLALVAVIAAAFKEGDGGFGGAVDIRALLLVCLAPVLVLVLFQKNSIPWQQIMGRVRELSAARGSRLFHELHEQSEAVVGVYGYSAIFKLSSDHPDSFFRYGGGLIASKFTGEELARFLSQRIDAEDSQWQAAADTFGFMAKMAPYFGMLATVIGMIRLLEHMNDFTKISGSMALAMQGTLYGLVCFTLIYAPIQKFLQGYREDIFKRNQAIARWLVLASVKADAAMIREELHSSGQIRRHSAEWTGATPAPQVVK